MRQKPTFKAREIERPKPLGCQLEPTPILAARALTLAIRPDRIERLFNGNRVIGHEIV
jgi:hypothetical protein